jgi:formylglycine-generating enzyme required for sulfatase activity
VLHEKNYGVKLRKFIILISFMCFVLSLHSLGKLRVETIKELPSTYINIEVRDADGKYAPVLIVKSELKGLGFKNKGRLTKHPPEYDDRRHEYKFYLNVNQRVIEITHPDYEPLEVRLLADYSLEVSSQRWYEMALSNEPEKVYIPVNILTNPSDALKIIDEENLGTGQNFRLSIGKHNIVIEKEGYQNIYDEINVSEDNTLFQYQLMEIEDVSVQITSVPSRATVFINAIKIGNTPVATFYPAGEYPFKIEKKEYVTINKTINIQPTGFKENYQLEEDFGLIYITSSPQSLLDIYINDINTGEKTSFKFERKKPGEYKVQAKTNFYETKEQTFSLQRGENKKVNLNSIPIYATLTINTYENAFVELNGNKITELKNIKLEPMLVNIKVTMPKATPLEERIELKIGDVKILDLYPNISTGTIQVAVVPFDAFIELKGDAREHFTSKGMKIFKDIPIGTYELTVKHDGYKTFKEPLALEKDEKIQKQINLEEGSDILENMIFVQGRTRLMGSNNGNYDEKPVHAVTVYDFYIGKYEVTQKEWKAVMGSNPSNWKGDDLSVERISWYDAIEFCNNKSIQEGLTPCYSGKGKNTKCNFNANGYRLPTEAEWEYAARGGNKSKGYKYSGSNNIGDVAWYSGNSGEKTHKVGTKQANELGIHDMSGNIWEWCNDWYDKDYYNNSLKNNPQGPSNGDVRVLRGGSWRYSDYLCRSASRHGNSPDSYNDNYGFRFLKPVK